MFPGEPIASILSHYPTVASDLIWQPLGSAGGYSGAHLWEGRDSHGQRYALKAYPTDFPPDRLLTIHRLMRQAWMTLPFVPVVEPTRDFSTIVVRHGRVWDLTSWMPGIADFDQHPSEQRLRSVMVALARLHLVWRPSSSEIAPCPAVLRRLELFRYHGDLVSRPIADSAWQTITQRSRILLDRELPRALVALQAWEHRPVLVQPCLCDPWHDHLLFQGDDLTGVIDYGSVKIDHPAVDLARVLGDLVPGNPIAQQMALDEYRKVNGGVSVDPLVGILTWTGGLGGIVNWFRRYHRGEIPGAMMPRVRLRIERLLDRTEREIGPGTIVSG